MILQSRQRFATLEHVNLLENLSLLPKQLFVILIPILCTKELLDKLEPKKYAKNTKEWVSIKKVTPLC